MVAVIIVNYNGLAYLPDCLTSLKKQTFDHNQFEVFIVDNNSGDHSVDYIKTEFNEFNLFELKENLGFAGGNNYAIRKAMAEGCDYFVLLNQDTIVEPDWLKNLLEAAEADDQIGLVQSRLMLWPQTDKINSIGNVINYLGFGYTRGHQEPESSFDYPRQVHQINYASGAAMLIKRPVIEAIGMFDDDLFMYHEDLDLSWKARLLGYQVVLAAQSVVYHKYQFSRSIAKYYYMERNRFMVIFQNYKWPTIVLISPALILMETGLFFYSIYSGWWTEKVKVYRYLLNFKNLKNISAKRRIIQRKRKLSDKDVVTAFSGKVEFQDINNPVLTYIANPIFNLYWQVVKKVIFW
ncbi:MAG TPA: glycosyltransferase family 2 protein [Patescibacteria group bacterium]